MTPKIAVMTCFKPGDNTGGAVTMRSLLRYYPTTHACWLNANPSLRKGFRNKVDFLREYRGAGDSVGINIDGIINAFLWSVDIRLLRRIWWSRRSWNWLRVAAGFLLWQVWARLEVHWVQRFCRKNEVDVCFIVLDSPFIPFAWRFMKQVDLPVHIRVADDPKASDLIMDRSVGNADQIDWAFGECYQLADSCEVVSEGMRLYYKKRFGPDAIIIPPQNDMPIKKISRPNKKNELRTNLRLIHLGHLRRPERKNLEALLFALSLLREEYSVDCSIDFFGRPLERYCGLEIPDFATVHDWVSLDVLKEYLECSDFSYAAYSFSQEHRVFVETSFPNKISSSMKSGLPILFHGPSYSSVSKFLDSYNAGIVLDTLDAREIANRIMAISEADIEDMRVECLRAAVKKFDPEVIFERWTSAIDSLIKY